MTRKKAHLSLLGGQYSLLEWIAQYSSQMTLLASRRFTGTAIAVIALVVTSGCVKPRTHDLTSANHTPQDRAKLRISVLPTQSEAEQMRMIAPLDAHLEKVLGQPVDFLVAKSYKDNVEMVVDGRANAAYTGAVSYLEMEDLGLKVTPIVAPIDQFTDRPWYRSCLIVRTDSSIQTLEDLKGKRVAFVNPSSTSGYVMPLAALKKLNIDPQRDFAQVIFAGTHAKTEAMLEDGLVDAIATNIPSYIKRQQLGKLTKQNSKVLWQSPPVPHSPLLVSDELPPETIEKLKEAFLTIPNGIEDIVGTQAAGYTLVVASDYDPIRQLRTQLGMKVSSTKEVSP